MSKLIKLMLFVSLLAFMFMPVMAKPEKNEVHSNYETVLSAATIAAEAYKLDVDILMAIAYVESKFNPMAKNGSSVGLMQVHLKFHKPKFKGSPVYSPYANMFVGAQIFSDCMRKHKRNKDKSLRCYNGGGDKHYVAKVNSKLNKLKEKSSR